MSSDSSSLLKGVGASDDAKSVGDASNAGLVVNSGDVLESNGETACVMYPGLDSVPAGVTVAQKTVPMFGHFAKIILCNNIQLIC